MEITRLAPWYEIISLLLFSDQPLFLKVAGGNGAGSTSEKLSGPWGIYVDANSNLYVVDRGNHRVQFWATGTAFQRL